MTLATIARQRGPVALTVFMKQKELCATIIWLQKLENKELD
jgi:hypothetical protein